MSIKYNEFGEVISVNGITTGQHLGTPMQDAIGTPEENKVYAEELATVTRCENTIDDNQPTHPTGPGSEVVDAVLYTKQNPTPEQRAQARANTGAVSATEVIAIVDEKLSSITNAEELAY